MLNLAVIGGGRIGAVHAASVASRADARLAWVVDPIEGVAEGLARKYGARPAADYQDALADPAVDGVVIAAPTPTHVDLITASVRAGKAVLCEKPVDLSSARVDECIKAISALDPRVMIGFNRRFDPSFAEIHCRVQAGDIGSVEQLTIISRDPQPPTLEYLVHSGGLFKDMTIHDFDMARFFLGHIVEVSASGQNVIDPAIEELGDIDGAVTVLTSAAGAVATIINSRRATYGYDQRLEVFGSEGMLEASNHLATSVRGYNKCHGEFTGPYLNFFLERYTQAYAGELAAFVTAIESGTEPLPSIEDGRAALALAEAAETAARTGRKVAVDC